MWLRLQQRYSPEICDSTTYEGIGGKIENTTWSDHGMQGHQVKDGGPKQFVGKKASMWFVEGLLGSDVVVAEHTPFSADGVFEW